MLHATGHARMVQVREKQTSGQQIEQCRDMVVAVIPDSRAARSQLLRLHNPPKCGLHCVRSSCLQKALC